MSRHDTTIRKIGNSEGVILPKEILDRLNLKAGDSIVIVQEGRASPAPHPRHCRGI
jgi:putative addiction module antidote